MDDRLRIILFKTHHEYRDVKFSVYRTSLKLRRIQKSLKLDKIEVSNALSVLSQPLEGLSSSSPDQSYPNIDASGLQSVICRVFTQTQTRVQEDEVFPEALAELTTALILQNYDIKNEGIVSLQAVRSFFIVMCDRELVAKYRSLFWCHCEPGNKTLAKQDIGLLLSHVIQITQIIQESNHFQNIPAAVESCFSGIFGSGITEHDFIRWCLLEPQSILWLPTIHRLSSSEKSRHHVGCTLCKTRPIIGMRFRCLRCIDYNVCQRCFLMDSNHKKSHKSTHPVQEYVHPVGRKDSMKDLARTFRNIVTKRYKRKTFTRSFLPINQSGDASGMVTQTWQEQSIEMASVSLPNLDYGISGTENQDLSVSRMSAGFADVSQLADEEKEKLDRLIDRLEEERRRMMATTQLLTAAQLQPQIEPAPVQTQKSPREKEKERLHSELKDVRNYNRELEMELNELRACLHPGLPPRSSTPQLQQITPDNTHHTMEHTPNITQHTEPYYTPHSTNPKDPYTSHPSYENSYFPAHKNYAEPSSPEMSPYHSHLKGLQGHVPTPHAYSPDHNGYGAPSSVEVSPYQSRKIGPQHYAAQDLRSYSPSHDKYAAPPSGEMLHQTGSRYYTDGAAPHFEKLKSGETPIGYSPSRGSYELQGLSPKASRTPMKASYNSHRSQGNSPIPDRESPIEFPKRSFRSLGNSPRTVEPEFGNSPKVGPWGSQKVLPDAPRLKMTKPPHETPMKIAHQPPFGYGVTAWVRQSNSFDASSPQAMYKSIGKDSSSRSSSFSDVSRNSSRRSKQKRRSSHDRSYEDHKTSPSIQPTPHRHAEGPKLDSRTSQLTDSRSSHGSDRKSSQRRRSSHDRSSKTPQRVSPSLQQAYQQHLDAAKTPSEMSVHADSQHSYQESPEHGQSRPLTPKPRERHKRSSTPQRSHATTHSKSYDSDSLSDVSSKSSKKRSTKRAAAPKHSQSREGSRRSSKERKPTPQKRIHTSAADVRHSAESENVEHRHLVYESPDLSDSSHSHVSNKIQRSPMLNHAEPPRQRHRSRSGSSSKASSKSDKDHPELRSRYSRTDTHGSFVPPRKVTSHENLAFGGSHPGSMDSLDTLHGGASNPSLGVYGTSKSGTTTPTVDSPRNVDRYSDIHSSDPNLESKLPPELGARRGASPKPQKPKHSTPTDFVTQVVTSSSHVQSLTHDSLDTSRSSINDTKPHGAHTESHGAHTESHGAHTKSPSAPDKGISSMLNSSIASQKSGRKSDHAKKERSSTPKMKQKRSPSRAKKRKEGLTSDGETSDSRTTPEGDLEVKLENASHDHSFESPEEEMKFLISKLQGLMPSIHDHQYTESQSSMDLKSAKPMNEVLLAAHQTRQAIRLFTEYAIAVAAGEV